MPESDRPQVFLSYSKDDGIHWVEQLERQCSVHAERYELKYDKHIGDGAPWLDWIEIALAKMHVAVLLVGPGYLSSKFIREVELPRLLEAHKRGTTLFILVVGYCPFDPYSDPENPLGHLQASNEPEEPLEGLDEDEQNKIFATLAIKINEAVKAPVISPVLPLLQTDGLQYDRKAFPVAINKSGKPHRHIVVRRLVRSTPAPLGAKLILNWRTIGDGIDFLLQQLHEHYPEQAPDLCVGINGFGLALAGFLAGAYTKGRTHVVQARNDPLFHDPVIEAESLPDPSKVKHILVVDSEMKSGVATRKVVDWLYKKYRDDIDIKIAILAACRVQGKISAINDLWKQGRVPEDDPKYLPDYLSFISENLIEPPVRIR